MGGEMATGHLTLKDIAREAGVSVATLDRVLHGRSGVREDTARRVRETIDRHAFRPSLAGAELARAHRMFCVCHARGFQCLHAGHPGAYFRDVGLALGETAGVETIIADVFNPAALAAELEALTGRYDGIAVVALDHQSVRAAIDDLVEGGTFVVTLVSDVPGSRRHHYVGVDNVAAGRTAGSLIGRFLGGRSGKIGVIAGSQSLRDHAERIFGFNQVISLEHPRLDVLAAVEGSDQDDVNEDLTARLLSDHSDLIGLYNVGAGCPASPRRSPTQGATEPRLHRP